MSNDKLDWNNIFSIRSIVFTLLGVVCGTVAIKGFMIPNHFLDGGITGISILLHEFYHIPVSLPLVILNLPFVYLGYTMIGKNFAMHSLLAILLLALLLHYMPVPIITKDSILTALFGGFFIGIGIGFVIRGGGVIDGLEVIAINTKRKWGLTTSEIIMAINTTIFLIIAIYLGLEKAMYSILTYFTAIKVSDYIVDGFEEFTALTVISPNAEIIKSLIVKDFRKAITVYKGERGYLPESFEISHDCDIIVTVVTRLEIHKLKKAVQAADPQAFMFIQSIKEVGGGIISRRKKH